MRDPMLAFDQIIAEAQQEGKFEDLAGKGKPLVIDTSPDAVIKGLLKEANVSVTPEWITLAMEIDRLLEEDERALAAFAAHYPAESASLTSDPSPPGSSGAAPEPWWRRWWRCLLHGWGDEQTAARGAGTAGGGAALQQRWDRELSGHSRRLHTLNRKIRRFNQIVPVANRQRRLLPVEQRLQAFAGQFLRPEPGPEGGWQLVRGSVPHSLVTPPTEAQESEARRRDVLQAAALLRMRQEGRKPPPIG
jgi:hypothetical protein